MLGQRYAHIKALVCILKLPFRTVRPIYNSTRTMFPLTCPALAITICFQFLIVIDVLSINEACGFIGLYVY